MLSVRCRIGLTDTAQQPSPDQLKETPRFLVRRDGLRIGGRVKRDYLKQIPSERPAPS